MALNKLKYNVKNFQSWFELNKMLIHVLKWCNPPPPPTQFWALSGSAILLNKNWNIFSSLNGYLHILNILKFFFKSNQPNV